MLQLRQRKLYRRSTLGESVHRGNETDQREKVVWWGRGRLRIYRFRLHSFPNPSVFWFNLFLAQSAGVFFNSIPLYPPHCLGFLYFCVFFQVMPINRGYDGAATIKAPGFSIKWFVVFLKALFFSEGSGLNIKKNGLSDG